MDNQIKFDELTKDDELLEQIGSWIKESQTYHDYLLTKQTLAEEYYKGNQTDKDSVPEYLTDAVENRIFEGVETLVPIVTSSAHEFVVYPGSENEKAVLRAEKLQKVLKKKYYDLEMQKKLEEITRHLILYRFGVAKWEWSNIKDDIDVRVIDPRMVLIPKLACDPHELPYKIEIQEYSPEEIQEYFPKADVEKMVKEIPINTRKTNVEMKKTFKVYEVWTSYYVCWVSGQEILNKMPNPYYDFEGFGKKEILESGKTRERIIFRNHLDNPTDPFVFFTTFNIGGEPIGTTSITEIAIPIQDLINVQKRQIVDNLRRMGNGQVFVDSDAMSKEEAENITNEVGLVIHGEGVASQNKIRREPGTPLPGAHFQNLMHTESVFDNIFGVHASTRGVGGSKTLGGQMLSKQQDLTRIDLLTRVINRGVKKIADGLVQLMKMYYTEVHTVKILGEEDTVEFVRLNQDDIEDYIEIDVRSGNTTPVDKVSMRNEAIQLWQLGAIDPVTLFQRLEYPEPEKSAQRLLEFKAGQLLQKIQVEQMAKQTGGKAPEEEKGRGVETPQNVMQRSMQSISGRAPIEGKMPQA